MDDLLTNRRLIIFLFNTSLNDAKFSEGHGLDRIKGRVYLNPELNKMTSLPAPIFEPCLLASEENIINLYENPLQSRFVPCANRATARGAKKKIAKNGGAEKIRGAPKEREGRPKFR